MCVLEIRCFVVLLLFVAILALFGDFFGVNFGIVVIDYIDLSYFINGYYVSVVLLQTVL